jgi:hypothetical protein
MQGWRLYQRPASIFLPAGESSLCDPATFGPRQQVPVPLAGDREMDPMMYDHVDAPFVASSLVP